MVSIPQSSALMLRLLDELAEEEDATIGAVFGTREVANVSEAVPLLEMVAESKSLTIFYLWAGVIFDQLVSEVDRWPNPRANLYWPLPESERITSSR